MTEISKIREIVKSLGTLDDSEWQMLGNFMYAQKMDFIKGVDTEEKKVCELLKIIGVPTHIVGYLYLKESIFFAMNNPVTTFSITKELYPEVAKKFNSTASKVERAIRHAIEVAWDRGDAELQQSIFKNTISVDRGKPSNSEAITLLAEYVKLYM